MKKLVLLLTFFCVAAYGQKTFDSLSVAVILAEGNSCNFESKTLATFAEAEVRHNRIRVENEPTKSDAIILITPLVMEVTSRHCAASLSVEFMTYRRAQLKNNKEVTSRLVYCRRNLIASYEKSLMQRELNDSTKELINECITALER